MKAHCSGDLDVSVRRPLHFDSNTTLGEFVSMGTALSEEAGVLDSLHNYFVMQSSRLYRACQLFKLGSADLGRVLEIGAFYGYIPFMLQRRSSSYTVLEGDDPAVYPLQTVYQRCGIDFSCIDLFEIFGPVRSATYSLPIPDASYDTILCWETMEHFGFNPVKFVHEIHRILRPGGRVYITVPNKASFQSLVALMFGRGERLCMEGYFQFEDYELNGKKGFLGFHWREYTPSELSYLFSFAGFKIQSSGSFTAFHDHGRLSFARRILRNLTKVGTAVLPRYGTNSYLVAAP